MSIDELIEKLQKLKEKCPNARLWFNTHYCEFQYESDFDDFYQDDEFEDIYEMRFVCKW